MSCIKKVLLFSAILIGTLLLIPNICNAESASASNETTLRDAISRANSGEIDTISLTDSIVISGPLTDITSDLTIEGNGFTISGNDTWYANGGTGNQSIITSTGGTLTLKNLILKHGPKQGAQAYGNGKLILDGVTISDCKYSGLIANGGIIEIRDLNLFTSVGIEVGKSATNPVNTNPKLVMNGTLKSTSQAILYEDPQTKSQLTIDNEEDSENRLLITDDSIFITDSNNTVIYETKSYSEIEVTNSDMVEGNLLTVTINYNENTKKLIVTKNQTLSEYDLSDVKNVEGKVFVNFVVGDNEVFSENTPITADIELTAVYKEPETPSTDTPAETPSVDEPKDDTPKTGVSDFLGIALATLSISILLVVVLKRKF